MKKVKNENVASFLDVYDVSASKFGHFSNLGMYFKVIQLFKAKKVTLRDKKSQKWLKFPPFGLCFSGRDENRFLASSTPEPCANQCFLVHFARPDICKLNRVFTFSLLVKNLMVF